MEAVLRERGLLSPGVQRELQAGRLYWEQERRLCSLMLQHAVVPPGGHSATDSCGFSVDEVHQASAAKSFDYRLLHYLVLALRGQEPDPTLLEFLRVDEMLVDIGEQQRVHVASRNAAPRRLPSLQLDFVCLTLPLPTACWALPAACHHRLPTPPVRWMPPLRPPQATTCTTTRRTSAPPQAPAASTSFAATCTATGTTPRCGWRSAWGSWSGSAPSC